MLKKLRNRASSMVLAAGLALTTALPAQFAEAQMHFEVDYSNIHRHTLANGLEVLIVENHSVPIVTIEMAGRNGAFTQDPSFSGLSHLYEHMFFKANAVYPNQEAFMARQQELGMSWNGTTGAERVNYFFTLPSDLIEEGTEFMAAALLTPQFQPEELAREREVVLGEYDRSEANPFWHLYRATSRLLWYEHPSRKDPLGDRTAISNATVEQMEWMKDAYYVPNNSLLVYSGDITREEGIRLAEKHFGAWERKEDPHARYPVPEHPPLIQDVAAVVPQQVSVSVLQMSWHGPDTRSSVEDTYVADVFSYILEQGASALQKALVDSGIALSADISYYTQRYVGPISFTVVVEEGREAEAIAAMNQELQKFASLDYYTEEQLATAKTKLAISDLTTQQSSLDLSHTLSFWWCSADVDYYLNYLSSLENVTREDIVRFVERWMIGKPRATVLLTSTANAAQWSEERLLQLNAAQAAH